MRKCLAILLLAGRGWTAIAAEQAKDLEPRPARKVEDQVRDLLESGLSYQRAANVASATDVAGLNYTRAIERYRAATELDPDSYSGHFYWGTCLESMAERNADPLQIQRLLYQARGRFALASRHPDAGGEIFEKYGQLLLTRWVDYQATPAARKATLDEADHLLRNGIKRVEFRGDKARLESLLGLCQVLYAVHATDSAYQQARYKEAVDLFTSANAVKSMEQNAQLYGSWGLALLKLGQMTHDRVMIRSAAERFEVAADKDPKQVQYRYNVVCCFAVLNLPDIAMRHLRQCLENDPGGVARAAAKDDPDLENLRYTEEFKRLLSPAAPTKLKATPQISDR